MRISDWSSDVCSSDLVREIGVAQVLVLVLAVVVRRRQPEAALPGERDLPRRVLEIRAGAEAETLAFALGERIAEPGDDVGGVVELRDRREVRLDRVEAGLVDRCLVHARAVQPADLLFDRAGGGLVGARVPPS